MDSALTQNIISEACVSQPPISTNTTGSLSHKYRRRRKVENGRRLSNFCIVQRSILIFVCAMASVQAFSSAIFTGRRSLLRSQAPSKYHHLSPFSCKPAPSRIASTTLFSSDGEDESSKEEWQAILAAFQMYKAAYGNLKVPLRFVVPALAPWPEKAWGLKLGQKVAAIRSTGKYVHNEQRRKTLDDMGFVWRLRAESSSKEKDTKNLSFDQIYSALVAYREIVQDGKGSLNIPNNFEVPDCDPWPNNVRGLPLGRKLASIRSKSFLTANPGANEKLKAIGFQLDGKIAANDARFQIVYDALKYYKEIYNDLLVPQPFVVPAKSKEWPEHTWGLRLGARVNAIRSQGTFINSNPERRQLLDDLGFVWSPTKTERDDRRGRRRKEEAEAMDAKTKAMEKQEDITAEKEQVTQTADTTLESLFNGDFDFSSDAPPGMMDDGRNESPSWGLESGRRLEDVAKMAEEEAQATEEYKPPKNLAESLAEAAERAADVGVIERMDGRKRIIKGKRDKAIPWFNDDFGSEFVFDDVLEALSIYRSIYGDFSNLTDSVFEIPSNSDEFDDLEFPGDMKSDDSSSRAATAIASFEERRQAGVDSLYAEMEKSEEGEVMVRGIGSAPAVEVSASDWPDHLGGMLLGNIVKRIQDGSLEVKHLHERKTKLDALGFDWGDPKYFIDVPFEKAMCAMYAYYLVRGDMFVYKDFVMPDEDPWPSALAGYEVGEAVHRLRELQNFMEAYHPEKVSLLRMIDFVWFPTLALPIDPNEAEMTSEMELLNAFGHPDYAKMIDIPMGLPEKIVSDGPFFETDDPKLWWRKWHNWDYVQDYWYQQGRRDNAYVLRESGYHQMAHEHEVKYGPGLLTLIKETMTDLQNNGIEGRSDLAGLHTKLEFFRAEMTDCTDIPVQEKKQLLADMDSYLFSLSTGTAANFQDEEDFEYEELDGGEPNSYEFEETAEKEEEAFEEEDIHIEPIADLEDELGFR